MAITDNIDQKILRAKQSGYSDDQIYDFLKSKGMNPDQILNVASEPVKPDKSLLQKTGEFLGLGGLAKGGSQAIFFKTKEGKQLFSDLEQGKITEEEFKYVIGGDIATPKEVFGSAAQTGLSLATLGGAGTAGKLLPRIIKGTGLGTGFATAGALEEGRLPTGGELVTGGVLGGGIPVAGAGMSKLKALFTEQLPKRLIQSALGQKKSELLGGKDISEFVLKNKTIGTTGSLLNNAQSAVKKLGQEIQGNLERAPKTARILKNEILSDVASKVNQEGGAITSKEISKIINNLAPQVKGILNRQSLSLTEANRLRQALDKTLGDRGFLVSQLPFNKEILRAFDGVLRDRVKTLAPTGTRELFSELSKEITLRNALLERSATQAKNQIVNVFDLLLAGGGFLGAGAAGSFGAFAVKKGVQSTLGKTAGAKVLTKLGQVPLPQAGKQAIKLGILRGFTNQ